MLKAFLEDDERRRKPPLRARWAVRAGWIALQARWAIARGTARQKSEALYTSWQIHERMLADAPRMAAYQEAIPHHIRPGDAVLDLGTGTGILSFLASRAGARTVYAIERAGIIETAKRAADANGIRNVQFIHGSSSEISLPEKVDVILHEQMPHWIDKEHMIETIVDARERFLKPNGCILPALFDVYAEPVQLRPEIRQPFLWEHEFGDITYAALESAAPNFPKYRFHEINPRGVEEILSTPSDPLFSFDLHSATKESFASAFTIDRVIAQAGRMDALCFYWRTRFDEATLLDTCPICTDAPYHWRNLIYRLPAQSVTCGDVLSFEIEMPDLTSFREWRIALTRCGPSE